MHMLLLLVLFKFQIASLEGADLEPIFYYHAKFPKYNANVSQKSTKKVNFLNIYIPLHEIGANTVSDKRIKMLHKMQKCLVGKSHLFWFQVFIRVIPPETTQFLAKKKSWSQIFFSVKYTCI